MNLVLLVDASFGGVHTLVQDRKVRSAAQNTRYHDSAHGVAVRAAIRTSQEISAQPPNTLPEWLLSHSSTLGEDNNFSFEIVTRRATRPGANSRSRHEIEKKKKLRKDRLEHLLRRSSVHLIEIKSGTITSSAQGPSSRTVVSVLS